MRPFTTLALLAAAVALPLTAPVAIAAGQTAAAKPYTAAATPIVVLLGDPAAHAAMLKVLPALTPQIDGAKDQLPATLTLVAIKDQAMITDDQIKALDAELAKIK